MKFAELTDDDKVRYVQDKYAEIIGECVADPKVFDKLFPEIKDEPVFARPKMIEGDEKANETLLKTAQDSFNIKKKEFDERKNTRAVMMASLAKIKEREDCICEPKELNIDLNDIAPEFEPFIDLARVRAEAQTY